MRIYQAILLALLGGTGAFAFLHHQAHGTLHPLQLALAFFLVLNAIIALWELCLFFRIDLIERQHARFIAEYAGRELDRVKEFFTLSVPLGKVLSPTTWAELWSTYSVFDESYANRKSFGFFIDVGNGFTTLVPALLFTAGMTYELMPARMLGIIGAILFYQMWYGTLVYFGSFLFNKRYVGHTKLNLAVFVGLTNGLWFVFPVIGLWASVQMILTDSYALFR